MMRSDDIYKHEYFGFFYYGYIKHKKVFVVNDNNPLSAMTKAFVLVTWIMAKF